MGIVDALEAAETGMRHEPAKVTNLAKATNTWMGSWPPQPSYTDVLRASQMFDMCPREFVLNYWQPTNNKQFDWVSRMRMSMGTHLHDYVQNRVLGPMGVLYGNWVPLGLAHETVRGFHPDPGKTLHEIQHQKPITWRYSEDAVWDEGWRIRGHLDGYVCPRRIAWLQDNAGAMKSDPEGSCTRLHSLPFSEDELVLFELKTTGKYGFDKLSGPDSIADYYKAQAATYQRLTGRKSTLFWYIERDSLGSKTFYYDYDRGWWGEVRRKARIVWESIRDETLPEAMMKCKMPTDKRAVKCSHRDPCWLGRMDFKAFVLRGKRLAESSGRTLLDLSEWVEPED
jgi:hypothetical protein